MAKNRATYTLFTSKKLPVVYLYSWKGFTSILRSEFLMCDHWVGDVSYINVLFGKFKEIIAWHGTPLKKIWLGPENPKNIQKFLYRFSYLSSIKNIHVVLAASEETRKNFSNVFKTNKVIVLGNPRNDIFFNHDLEFHDYVKKLSLNSFSKIILYSPTFRDSKASNEPFSNEFLRKFNRYLTEKNYVFLIKSHKMDKFVKQIPELSNIRNVSDKVEDIQDLLIHVDILISDYSSIFFDFVLLDRPLIFYPYDLDEYLIKSREMYYDYFIELPGPFAKNENELFDSISNIESIFNNKNYNEKYKNFKKKFNYFQDGNSCKRLIEYLENG